VSRERRRFERMEVRRFTRRARNRRLAIASVSGLIVTLIGLVLAAVYSPLLALREISVDGASRVDESEVQLVLEGHLGTPLALLDFGKIESQLGAFPLIRSYVTETRPPGTLLIHIIERQPVASIKDGSQYLLIDPAGVAIQESVERIPGVPLIDLGTREISGALFDSIIELLLALPAPLLAQVDTVTARTQDDLRMTFTGVGQQVSWGSSADSAAKAVLLGALIGVTDPTRPGLFDVSAPSNGVFRPF
jgi:cell division protein FtsQ